MCKTLSPWVLLSVAVMHCRGPGGLVFKEVAFYARGKLTGELWGGANLRETETNPPTQSSNELGAAAGRQTAHDILPMVSLGEPGNWAWGQGAQALGGLSPPIPWRAT